ncbi:Mu-like prophage FluMu protein GP28 [Rhodopseudomonas palustris TIE-1]|uniref:terminase large subunit domain-containing protein n=1 Tax=Rhodopseudomonas palustris TaxID=1076 RepID=UPI000164A84E|nr:terminase family protein [Rhodopseudomonas palustris]ACF01893.1 Mu-like prophage FluMu protein GP28 [Rhodopseudomonas palustris TIE-1]
MTDPRAISEADWAEARRAGMASAARIFADRGSIEDVLIGYQKRLLASTALHQVTLCEKSRRIGATWAVAADAVLTSAATKAAGGMDTFYIGYNLDMAREFIDTCAMWARSFNEAAPVVNEFMFDDGNPDRAIKAFRIAFASGFEIVALASRPRSLRGRQGYVIIDEAAFHDDLAGVMKAAIALLMWGGKVLVISTHLGAENAFAKLIDDARGGRNPYHVERFTFDDALNDGLYQRICLVTGKEWTPEGEAKWRAGIIASYGEDADEELFCVPSKGGGVYFPRPLIEARMLPDLPVVRLERNSAFTFLPKEQREADIEAWCEEHLKPLLDALDPERQHGFGQDFARTLDLSVIAPIAIGKTLKRTVPFSVEMRNIPFEQQRQVLFYVCDRLPRFVGGKMDASGNGAYLAEVAAQRYGQLRVEQVKLTAEWYLDNFQPLKTAFEDGMIAIPQHADLIDDLGIVRKERGIPRIPDIRTKAADGSGKRHGDFAIALVLAYAQTRSKLVEFGYRGAGDSAASGDGPPDDQDDARDWWRQPLGAGLRGGL